MQLGIASAQVTLCIPAESWQTCVAAAALHCRGDWSSICNGPNCRLLELKAADELELRQAFKEALLHVRFLVVRDNNTQDKWQNLYSGEQGHVCRI